MMKNRMITRDTNDESDSGIVDDNTIAMIMIKMMMWPKFSLYFILGMSRQSFVVLTIAMTVSSWVYAQDRSPGWLLGSRPNISSYCNDWQTGKIIRLSGSRAKPKLAYSPLNGLCM